MDEGILVRIRALLARAGHEGTPEEEARTAGVIAARLIYKYKILIGSDPIYDSSDDDNINSNDDANNDTNSDDRRSNGGTRSDQNKGEYHHTFTPKRYIVITSRYIGWCQSCCGETNPGETLAWVHGYGATHWGCRKFWSDGIRRSRDGDPW